MAYQYTTITSVQLLDCFTIPVVMILSCYVLGARYRLWHYVGAITALLGLGLLVTADALQRKDESDEPARGPLLGDFLVMAGACLYAISNIGQEYMVKERDRVEFLAFLGTFGAIISGIQMSILERPAIRTLCEEADATIFLYLLGFTGCLLGMYVCVPLILERSSAAFMNLSLLTADFYSLLVALVLFSASPSVLYFVAFSVIICGLVVFNKAGEADSASGRIRSGFASPSEEEMSNAILDVKVSSSEDNNESLKSERDLLPGINEMSNE
eukprot:CAMPEP_0167755402 /NCGR_PEP_ID=MMETSP0110_2-20121227/8800_1 /TAXON_ID=629695 /ORGANISM="Gymnochlora sp., Strain CCMP2014" /LENGTH=270 /DNA_ID=CAMNT_0007641377 /DNA_START=298 /DNA_END=1107 /DNA_ORIENTATION=+